jgi:hypothetical protein
MQEVDYTGAGNWTGDCGEGMTPGAQQLRAFLDQRYSQIQSIGGFSCRHIVGNPSKASVHSTGRALDIMLPLGFRNDADNSKGDPIADFLIANAEDIGIQYFIWDRTSWNASRATGKKERFYNGAHPHNDHLHVELSLEASRGETAWLEPGWEPLEVEVAGTPPSSDTTSVPASSEPVPLDLLPEEPQEDPPEEEAPQDPAQREPLPEDPPPAGPCEALPAEGGVIDSGCLWLRGPSVYWNQEAAGQGGELAWTTALQSGAHVSSAEWQINLQEAGEYELEVYVESEFSQHDRARYVLEHGRSSAPIIVDLSTASGWHSLGNFAFAQGDLQKLTLFDNNDGPVEPNIRIVADAIRLRPIDAPDEPDNMEEPTDPSDPPPRDDSPDQPEPDPNGEDGTRDPPEGKLAGGCQQAPGNTPLSSILFLLTALLFLGRRRSRPSVR